MKKWLTAGLLALMCCMLAFSGVQAEDVPQGDGQGTTQQNNAEEDGQTAPEGDGDNDGFAPEEDAALEVEDYSFTLTAAPLTYGMHLQDSAISAQGSTITINGETVPAEILGTFLWRDSTQVPTVGTWHQYAYFSPNQELGAAFEDIAVEVRVGKARPQITVKPEASALTYGQSLSQSKLSGGVAMNEVNSTLDPVQGVFEWELRDMVPSVGLQEATVVFTPIINAADLYETAYFTVQVQVEKMPVKLTEHPVPSRTLRYGESLAALQLTGGRAEDEFGQTVNGTFAFTDGDYVPAVGTHTAEVVFTPADHAHRKEVRISVQLTVEKGALTAQVQPVDITYGQALSEGSLSGKVLDEQGKEVSGIWAFADGSLTPSVGESGLYDAVFAPADGKNYAPVNAKVQVNVHKKQLFLTWGENGKYMGEKDGAFVYTVPGMPEGMSLQGTPERDAGEEVGIYKLHADNLFLPVEMEENYLLIKAIGEYTISRYETSARANVSGEEGDNGWYTGSAALTAPEGFEAAFTEGGAYARTLSLPESAGGADYYLKVVSDAHQGAVAGPYHADYKLDTTAPEIDVAWQEGNEFTLIARDGGSGVDRIYGIFAGPSLSYEGAEEAEYAYAARETGNYTYVVHDLAGHTAMVTLGFADTDEDGLTDVYEERTGTSVLLADTDKDGITDFDARRIRNLLGYDRLDVSASVMLGALTDGGEQAVALPENSRGLLVRDDVCALRQGILTGRGLMRVNASGCYGMTADILWFENEEGAYSAIHMEGVSGKAALSCNAPGGVIALCSYDDRALDDIRVADLRTGAVMIAEGTCGAERFDLSPDGKYLGYAKDGHLNVLSMETGEMMTQVKMDAGCIFRFDLDGRLVTENGVLHLVDDAWQKDDKECLMQVHPLAQVRRGESTLWLCGEEDHFLLRASGSASRSDGGMDVELQSAFAKAEAGLSAAEMKDMLLTLALSDETARWIESLDLAAE